LTPAPPQLIIGSMSTVDDPLERERLQFLQGTLEVLILRSLKTGPNHAYGISQFLEQESENEFLVDNGSLYPALQRLLQRQWIAAQWKTSPNGRRAKYYRLTPSGRRQLQAATSKWLRFVEAMGRILSPEG
jgi:PadR family transcriptional regulator PadR